MGIRRKRRAQKRIITCAQRGEGGKGRESGKNNGGEKGAKGDYLSSFAAYFTTVSCEGDAGTRRTLTNLAASTETGIFVSRKFQVPPVNWRLTLCSVALREKISDDTDGPNISPGGETRIMRAEPVFAILLLSSGLFQS